VKRQDHWHNTFARLHGIEPKDSEGLSTSVEIKKPKRFLPFAFLRRPPSRISRNLEGHPTSLLITTISDFAIYA
jgi:hypothetical protein